MISTQGLLVMTTEVSGRSISSAITRLVSSRSSGLMTRMFFTPRALQSSGILTAWAGSSIRVKPEAGLSCRPVMAVMLLSRMITVAGELL